MKADHYPGPRPPAPARAAAIAVLLTLACLLAACGRPDVRPAPTRGAHVPRSWPMVEPEDPAAANAVLMRALSLVGTP